MPVARGLVPCAPSCPHALAAISQILGTINNILSGITGAAAGVGGVMWIMPQQAFQSWSA